MENADLRNRIQKRRGGSFMNRVPEVSKIKYPPKKKEVKVLSQVEFDADKQAEHQARKPYPSWVGDIDTMSWQPPLPYPQDDKRYYWDELTINWVEVINEQNT